MPITPWKDDTIVLQVASVKHILISGNLFKNIKKTTL